VAEDVYRLEGADTLRATLAKAAHDLGDLSGPGKRSGAVVVARARSLVPRLSGALQGSIRAEAAKQAVDLMAGYASVPYAGVIEGGWRARNIRPQPYLRPALAESESEVEREYEGELEAIAGRIKGA